MGIFPILSDNLRFPPELEPGAMTYVEVFSAITTFSKSQRGKSAQGSRTSGKLGVSPCSSESKPARAQLGMSFLLAHDLGHVLQRHVWVRGAENNLSLGGDRLPLAIPSSWLCPRTCLGCREWGGDLLWASVFPACFSWLIPVILWKQRGCQDSPILAVKGWKESWIHLGGLRIFGNP